MKLFEVSIEVKAYVWAGDSRDAERIAQEEIRDIIDGADVDAFEFQPTSSIYRGYEDTEPFGEAPEDFDGMTLSEICEKQKEEDLKIDRDTLPLPGVTT